MHRRLIGHCYLFITISKPKVEIISSSISNFSFDGPKKWNIEPIVKHSISKEVKAQSDGQDTNMYEDLCIFLESSRIKLLDIVKVYIFTCIHTKE